MGDAVLTQGLAAKLFMPPTAATKDTLYLQGDGWLDVDRSNALWRSVFVGPQSVIKSGDWIDRPSVGIPYLYVATGIELAEALKQQGKTPEAKNVFDLARRIATTVRLDDLIRAAEAEFNQVPTTGDTARALPLPPAKTDSASKPGAKAPPSTPKKK
jgi:hypothetical protein